MKSLRKFYLQVNLQKDPGGLTAHRVAECLLKHGGQVVMNPSLRREVTANGCGFSDTIPSDTDCILVIGGDGSLLVASEVALEQDIPLLGINLGHLGYLAELSPEKIPLLKQLISGDYSLSERMTLALTFERAGKTEMCVRPAVNEVAVTHAEKFEMADLLLTDSDNNCIRYRGDGIIIATPSGSTAYSFSAGGPVIYPDLSAICVTPICPHSLFNRAMVLPGTSRVRVESSVKREGHLAVCIDGRTLYSLGPGESVSVTKGTQVLKMVSFGQHGMINTLRQKMQEAELKY